MKLSAIYPYILDMVVNEIAFFICKAELPPKWTFQGGDLPSNAVIIPLFHPLSILQINQLELKNHGTYECYGLKENTLISNTSQMFLGTGTLNVFGNV